MANQQKKVKYLLNGKNIIHQWGSVADSVLIVVVVGVVVIAKWVIHISAVILLIRVINQVAQMIADRIIKMILDNVVLIMMERVNMIMRHVTMTMHLEIIKNQL